MLKKVICLLAVLMLMLTACGGGTGEDTTPSTEETKDKMANALFEADPGEDGVLRILAIGNSFCYYFCDELYGMLEAEGIQAQVANVYYSGCTVQRHWTWLNDMSTKYELIIHSENGKTSLKDQTLLNCLKMQNWDVITLQQHYNPSVAEDYEAALESCQPYTKDLFDYLKDKFPLAELLWQQTWAYQVGYEGPAGKDPADVEDADKVLAVEKQTLTY